MSSAMIQPIDQTSIFRLYLPGESITSGALYHRVTTYSVYSLNSVSPNSPRASPVPSTNNIIKYCGRRRRQRALLEENQSLTARSCYSLLHTCATMDNVVMATRGKYYHSSG
mmetsp:Transcript_31379/g.50582  ORF Transcript_31379/g.50582 Transcript_31379/m.50582 type:complete len:112 (-) Transcript_31379:792-1127(-)